jgi:hypothetical protein
MTRYETKKERYDPMALSILNAKRNVLGLAILTCVVAGTASVSPVGRALANGFEGPTTFISNSSATAVHAISASGFGAKGESGSYVGVGGYSTSYIGIFGKSTTDRGVAGTGPTGVYGTSTDANGNLSNGIGVHGISAGGFGAKGESGSYVGVGGYSTSYIGIFGKSTTDRGVAGVGPTGVYGASQDINGNMIAGIGVHGVSNSAGRGGVFEGGAAQVQLVPSTAPTHPVLGQAGDLFLDANHHLWLCLGGASWKQLA